MGFHEIDPQKGGDIVVTDFEQQPAELIHKHESLLSKNALELESKHASSGFYQPGRSVFLLLQICEEKRIMGYTDNSVIRRSFAKLA